MKQQGMLSDVITYNALISACEKGNQPQQALQLFEAMRQQGMLPDVITHSVLISTCEKRKQLERAPALRGDEAARLPDVITYNALISACESQSKHQLFEAMKQQGFR